MALAVANATVALVVVADSVAVVAAVLVLAGAGGGRCLKPLQGDALGHRGSVRSGRRGIGGVLGLGHRFC